MACTITHRVLFMVWIRNRASKLGLMQSTEGSNRRWIVYQVLKCCVRVSQALKNKGVFIITMVIVGIIIIIMIVNYGFWTFSNRSANPARHWAVRWFHHQGEQTLCHSQVGQGSSKHRPRVVQKSFNKLPYSFHPSYFISW